jgi:hypothetical protein
VPNSTSTRSAISRRSVRRCRRTTGCKMPLARRLPVSTSSRCSSSGSAGDVPSGARRPSRGEAGRHRRERRDPCCRVRSRRRCRSRVNCLEDPLPEGYLDLAVSALAVHHLDGAGKGGPVRPHRRPAPAGRTVRARRRRSTRGSGRRRHTIDGVYDKPSTVDDQAFVACRRRP